MTKFPSPCGDLVGKVVHLPRLWASPAHQGCFRPLAGIWWGKWDKLQDYFYMGELQWFPSPCGDLVGKVPFSILAVTKNSPSFRPLAGIWWGKPGTTRRRVLGASAKAGFRPLAGIWWGKIRKGTKPEKDTVGYWFPSPCGDLVGKDHCHPRGGWHGPTMGFPSPCGDLVGKALLVILGISTTTVVGFRPLAGIWWGKSPLSNPYATWDSSFKSTH